MKYNPQDFAANHDKYTLFKTARVAKHVFTNNGESDLPEGEIVGIAYRFDARNQLFRRTEPIYTVTRQDGSIWGDVYGNVLGDFAL